MVECLCVIHIYTCTDQLLLCNTDSHNENRFNFEFCHFVTYLSGWLKSFSLKSQTTSSFVTGVCYHGDAYCQVCCHGEALYQVRYRDGDVYQVCYHSEVICQVYCYGDAHCQVCCHGKASC